MAFASATGAVGLSNLAMYAVLLAIPIAWARAGRPTVATGGWLVDEHIRPVPAEHDAKLLGSRTSSTSRC